MQEKQTGQTKVSDREKTQHSLHSITRVEGPILLILTIIGKKRPRETYFLTYGYVTRYKRAPYMGNK